MDVVEYDRRGLIFVLENLDAQAIRRRNKGLVDPAIVAGQHCNAAAFHLATASCTFGTRKPT